ncbi:unnamed protein product [Closterium sp. Naga37s-1]|nr:unnamed protein product [Closterium sp. Naga37s-1]
MVSLPCLRAGLLSHAFVVALSSLTTRLPLSTCACPSPLAPAPLHLRLPLSTCACPSPLAPAPLHLRLHSTPPPPHLLSPPFLPHPPLLHLEPTASVVRYDFNVGREDVLGHHQGAVKCVEYSHATGQLITGGWDRTVRCWDPRAPASHLRLTVTAEQPERCYSMSLAAHRLVVAMAGRHVSIYDLRNMSQPEQRRESSLKFQTRCVRCYPTGTGYALASVEGRVAMEFFDPSETAQTKKYAFKCHRRSEGGRDTVFPVNAIAFHPIYGTFATGGCDGVVNIWDGNNKKRLYQYAKYPTSIAALSFSRDGRLLAVAASYTFEMGDIPHERDAIHIRNVNDAEVKPKPKAYSTAT